MGHYQINNHKKGKVNPEFIVLERDHFKMNPKEFSIKSQQLLPNNSYSSTEHSNKDLQLETEPLLSN